MVDDETLRVGLAPTTPEGRATATSETVVPVRYSLTDRDFQLVLPDHGYDLGGVLGRGGMGEVLAAHDRRISRDVAVKRMTEKNPTPESVSRFLREARIQARLDHPAIVPVHELGTDAEGRPFFTMKRLAGVTLADKLAAGGWELRPLLHAFVDVCRAMRFAHERGVVHRDLKPSNIMLGEYDEVYVLDWGVARVLAENDGVSKTGDIQSLGDHTRTGALLGTPGYMAPEQIRAEAVEPKADVYALGSVLFEILAAEPLHPRGQAAIANTLSTPQHSPAKRKPDRAIPPELDRICFDALDEIAVRRPSVRQLGEAVQRYLDGDRDVERRRTLAADLVEQARTTLASHDPEAHAIGMRLAGRALALDQESKDAAALVTANLLKPPEVLPASCLAALRAEATRAALQRSRTTGIVVLSVFVLVAVLPLLHVRSWPWVCAFYGIHAVVGGYLLFSSRGHRTGYLGLLMIGALAASVVWSQIASPFLLTPVMLCVAINGFAANEKAMMRPWVPVVWASLAVMLPLILEWTGVLAPTITVAGDALRVTSNMYEITGATELGTLTIANLLFIVAVAFYAINTNRIAYASRRNLSIRNWQLDQIVAHAAKD